MTAKRYRWLMIMTAALCLAAQSFVIVPHHHHGESEAPCLNIAHCISHTASHAENAPADCCHDHCTPEQSPVSEHECGFRVDTPEPANARLYNPLPDGFTAVVNDLYAPEAFVAPEQPYTEPFLTLTRRRQSAAVPDLCVTYLAETRPARAPSHLV